MKVFKYNNWICLFVFLWIILSYKLIIHQMQLRLWSILLKFVIWNMIVLYATRCNMIPITISLKLLHLCSTELQIRNLFFIEFELINTVFSVIKNCLTLLLYKEDTMPEFKHKIIYSHIIHIDFGWGPSACLRYWDVDNYVYILVVS